MIHEVNRCNDSRHMQQLNMMIHQFIPMCTNVFSIHAPYIQLHHIQNKFLLETITPVIYIFIILKKKKRSDTA